MRKKQEKIWRNGKTMQRLLSLVLCLILCGQLLPVTVALADEPNGQESPNSTPMVGAIKYDDAGDLALATVEQYMQKIENTREAMTLYTDRVNGNIAEALSGLIQESGWNYDYFQALGVDIAKAFQTLVNCLYNGTAPAGYTSYETVKERFREFITQLNGYCEDFRTWIGAALTDEASMEPATRSAFGQMKEKICDSVAACQYSIDLMETALINGSMETPGKLVIVTAGGEATAEEAKRSAAYYEQRVTNDLTALAQAAEQEKNQGGINADVYVEQSVAKKLLTEAEKFETGVNAIDFPYLIGSEGDKYLAALGRYAALRYGEILDNPAVAQNDAEALLDELHEAEKQAESLLKMMPAGSAEYIAAGEISTGIHDIVASTENDWTLYNSTHQASMAKTYAEAKRNLDEAYQRLDEILLCLYIQYDNCCKKDPGEYVVRSKNFDFGKNGDAAKLLTKWGISGNPEEAERVLRRAAEQLRSAYQTIIEGRDTNGNAFIDQYAAERYEAEKTKQGFADVVRSTATGYKEDAPFPISNTLTDLLTREIADFYYGAHQSRIEMRKEASQDPERKSGIGNNEGNPYAIINIVTGFGVEDLYDYNPTDTDVTDLLDLCLTLYTDALREAAWRSAAVYTKRGSGSGQTLADILRGTTSQVTNERSEAEQLREAAESEAESHFARLDQIRFGSAEGRNIRNYSDHWKEEYVREAVYSQLRWRAYQDAYEQYMRLSHSEERLPGMTAALFESYQEMLGNLDMWLMRVGSSDAVTSNNLDRLYLAMIPAEHAVHQSMIVSANGLAETIGRPILNLSASPYSDQAIAAEAAKGTDMRTFLRLQLAELRVWDTALSYAVDGSDTVGRQDNYFYQMMENDEEGFNVPDHFSVSSYVRAVMANAEAERMRPLIHNYREQLEAQYEKYANAVENEAEETSLIPTTDKTPEQIQQEIETVSAELNEKTATMAKSQEDLDSYVTDYTENGSYYPAYKEALDVATKAYQEVKTRYDTLQAQLIFACMSAGNKLIEMVNSDPNVLNRNVKDLEKQIAFLEEKLGLQSGEEIPAALLPESKAADEETDEDEDIEAENERTAETAEEPEKAEKDEGGTADLTQEEIYAHQLKEAREALAKLMGKETRPEEEESYQPFPEFSRLSEGELHDEIQKYQEEVDDICGDTVELYRDLRTQYEKYQANPELREYQALMSLASGYSQRSERVEDLYRAMEQANAEIKLYYPPATMEEAEQRFLNEYTSYYYAQRDYLEFSELEMNLIQGEYDHFTANSKQFDAQCWQAVYAENEDAKRLLDDEFQRLKAAFAYEERALWGDDSESDGKSHVAAYLSDKETFEELSLAGDALQARINAVKQSYDESKAQLNAVAKTMHFIDADEIDLRKDKRFNESYAGLGTQTMTRLSRIDELLADEKLWNFVACSGSPAYIEAAAYNEMCKVRYEGPADVREELMNRASVMTDQFAVQVDTGATAGTGKILFFTVCYTDTDGVERKEYLFPTLDANEMTQQRLDELTENKTLVNQKHMDTMAKLGQTGSSVSEIQSLDSWSTDTYLFSTQYHMAEKGLKAFEAFCENVHTSISEADADAKNEWSCSGMRLYHVDDVFGQSVYGYGGSDQTRTKLEFQGQQIGALNKFSYSVAWACAKMLRFGDSGDGTDSEFTIDCNSYDYKTEKIDTGSLAGKIVAKSDEESEYLFKLDFADSYGAGIEPLVTRYSDNGHSGMTTGGTGTLAMSAADSLNALKASATAGNNRVGIQPCKIKDLGLPECLVYTIVYYDMNDCCRQVRVPVITSSLAWAVDHGISENDSIFGYAQQGDSLVFSAYLPDMKEISLKESYLCFEAVNGWEASSQASNSSKTHIDERLEMLNNTVSYESANTSGSKGTNTGHSDSEIRLSGMQIYAPGTYAASVSLENGVIEPVVEGAPAYFETAATVNGEGYAYGEHVLLSSMRTDYQEGIKLKPHSDGQKYMVIISTDYTSLSATAESPNVTVEYVSLSGRVVSSSAEEVGESSRDYYGYWPGINNEDITTERATGESGELKMLFTIDDLNYFSNVLISMDSTARDDWQISGIKILKLNSLGKRQGTWEVVENSRHEILSDRSYDRELDGTVMLEKDETILIQPGDSKRIVIHGDSTEVQEQEEVNWEEKRYYMDVDTAMSDLGFTKERANYTVKVKVAGENNGNTIDGDCGSVNPFYFQLVFANGKSGYVLANQQLSGDGFRTGYNERFTIATNRDYGELKAVRIIPDDTSSNSQIFDKLNIDSIEVSRESDNAVNRTWVINKVGWIEIDYHDEAETYSISGRDGRAEGSLARNFNVDYSTYSTKLLFTINTAQPDANTDHIEDLLVGQDEETQEAIIKALTEQSQFQGEVSLNLTYRDSKGNVQHDTFDMVQAIAAYANKKINTQEATDTEGNIIHSETVSDTSYMFRMGHTDRFELEIRDAQRLLNASIIATGVADQSCFWKIADFRAMMINENGVLNINGNNEYEKTNAANATPLCEGKSMPFTMWIPARHTEEIQFFFTDNEINVSLDDDSWEVAAERVPDSDNDVANVYVYLADDSKMPHALMGQIKYTNGYGLAYQTSQRELLKMSDGKGFYASNIDVMGMSVLNSITLDTLDAAATQGVKIDRVVIQQVRSDVVINTCTCNLTGNDGVIPAGGKLTVYPGGTASQGGDVTFNTDTQVMTLAFGKNTETARLVAENRDIAVAIRYTTTNDTNEREYNSPYVYLTDQQIKSIVADGTVQIEFHEPYVNKIKGMVILATGKLKAELASACVGVYEKDPITEEDQCLRWYSFSNFSAPMILSAQSRLLNPSADNSRDSSISRLNTVCPLILDLTTGEVSESAADPQTTNPIKMVVSYVDSDGKDRTVTFDDIRNNLIEGGFGAGETAKIRVMLVGVQELTDILLEPYSADSGTESQDDWYISAFALAMNQNTSVYRYANVVGRTAIQGLPVRLNTSAITLRLQAETSLRNRIGRTTTETHDSAEGPIMLTVQPDQQVKLNPILMGSSRGVKVTVMGSQYMDADGNTLWEEIPTVEAIKSSDGKYTFSMSSAGSYRVIFTSIEDPAITQGITITVEPPFGFNASDLVIQVGEIVTIQTNNYPDGMTWSSSNILAAVVVPLNGRGAIVTGITPGRTRITARDSEGRTESCVIEVVAAPSADGE